MASARLPQYPSWHREVIVVPPVAAGRGERESNNAHSSVMRGVIGMNATVHRNAPRVISVVRLQRHRHSVQY